MNHLAEETSPYLRQHRDNPVDWYPWSDEALARARELDRPILLSVGYSACHWCHVMAHQCFEDDEVAQAMNDAFVNIKVDREERPDVDAIYMDAVQAQTGSGGWPMTVFLTPDGRPFFGGTYFPKPVFLDLLGQVSTLWQERRGDIERDADRLADAVRSGARVSGATAGIDPVTPSSLSPALLTRAAEALRQAFDPEWGGFGRAPKFPQATIVELALRRGLTDVVTTTLDAMASGGIYDHLGGGFARYAVERTWLVPHFEKMLYDNAQLIRLYTHGWQVTGADRYRQVVEETVGYLLRSPMRSPEGGIHAAEDADSEGVEGKFYVWDRDQVEAIGGPAAVDWYGVTSTGNWEGKNILWRPRRGDLIRPPEVEAARRDLFEVREGRVHPGLDDKVVTEWNAMAVAALAEAGAAFGRPDWVGAGREVAEFLVAALRRPDGRWLRAWQGGRAGRHLAYAIDYAWLVEALTRLGEATGEARWVAEAMAAADDLLRLFGDAAEGGFFTAGSDAEKLLVRSKDTYDGATPSANSVAAVALLRLAALTGAERYRDAAATVISMMATPLERQPLACTQLLAAVDLMISGTTEVAVTGARPDLVAAVAARYLPNAVIAWGEPYDSPLWEGRTSQATADKAFVCRNYTCSAPADDVAGLLERLAAA
ncbi:MAG TPA: thioredoxin domain-containing protein [Acidimicrobiales bacterium]|nr:thioredoxin domain-containing protein [Acidimicrobiales bacterium]